MNDIFGLGRYAPYILPAFAAAIAGFTWMIADTLLRARRWRREVERLESIEEP